MTVRKFSADWAFVLAREEDGWSLKCVQGAGTLAQGGCTLPDLDEVKEHIRLLADLLQRDDLTRRLAANRSAAPDR